MTKGDGRSGAGRLPAPDEVARWEAFGGVWEIAHAGPARAIVLLRRCDGGEIVETFESEDPSVVRWAEQQRDAR